ncbi:uncharacterized protein LOC143299566 isoform X1 [Babylonia areolata]|uniref:uncharacterized protein LOC143299566 isoform X1 n=1 Tax=Babylonia areolata TaxID=304850 RepID=UPI003FD45891
MEKLDEDSAAKFINALIKSLQTLCHGYLNFDNGIEIVGHINLNVDKGSSMHYILEEKVCKNEENSTLFISNSFHAQNQNSKSKGKDSDTVGNRNEEKTSSADLGQAGKLSAISSISSALSKSHEKNRSGSTSSAKDSENLHSKPLSSTAKRKASDDYTNDVRAAKQAQLCSSPSPVSHFLSQSPHDPSGSSSPVDTKPSLRQLHGDESSGTVLPQTAAVSSDNAGDLGVNLVGSVLERVDDQSNSDLQDRGDDSDGDLEVTFIKEEYVEGEQSACQFENSGGQQYGRGTLQRASSSDMSDGSMYPVSLHHSQSASSTFVPSSHDLATAQHYGPSTSSQPQPGTSGIRGDYKSFLVHQARSSASESMFQHDRKKQEINIERQNKWALSHFRDWLAQENMPTDFETKPVEEIDSMLSQFFLHARKKNGDPFSVSALLAMRTALTRHLKGPPFYRNITLATDIRMKRSQSSFEQQMAQAGMCQSVSKAERISPEDYTRLYQSGVLSNGDPTSLLYKVWFELQWHFGRPGGRKSWSSIFPDSFVFDADLNGEFVYVRSFLFSNSFGGEMSSRRMYAQGGPMCPVRSLQLYLEKRNPHCEAFLQEPEKNVSREALIWYKPEGLKEYKLSCLMKILSSKARLSKVYTNLSVLPLIDSSPCTGNSVSQCSPSVFESESHEADAE